MLGPFYINGPNQMKLYIYSERLRIDYNLSGVVRT